MQPSCSSQRASCTFRFCIRGFAADVVGIVLQLHRWNFLLAQLLFWDTVGAEHARQKQMACHLLNDPGTNDSSQNFTLLLLTQWQPKNASISEQEWVPCPDVEGGEPDPSSTPPPDPGVVYLALMIYSTAILVHQRSLY
jgi:hypothetical protein